MVLNIIHESLMKYKMVYFTMLVLINLYILYVNINKESSCLFIYNTVHLSGM